MREQLKQEDVLRLIREEGEDAFMIFHKNVNETLLTRYRRNITALHKTMQEIKSTFPDANIYVASGTICLMLGYSHDEERNANPQRELVVDDDNRIDIDGGDW